MKLKAIIIDDEPKSVKLLLAYLNEFEKLEVTASGYSASEAYQLITKHSPDLVFLDISMPGENAFDLLKKFPERNFEVIFTTAYSQYALQAFDQHALNYLLKPIDYEKLEAVLERCFQLFEQKNIAIQKNEPKETEKLSIPGQNGHILLSINEIVHCEGRGCYTIIYTSDNKNHIASQNIKVFEDKLVSNGFFRVHKSHLINLAFLIDFSQGKGGELTLKNGNKIPISFRKKSEFVKLIREMNILND